MPELTCEQLSYFANCQETRLSNDWNLKAIQLAFLTGEWSEDARYSDSRHHVAGRSNSLGDWCVPAPQDPFNDSSGLRISAWISARYALSQWAMAKPGTQSAQKEYLDDHPDFG